MKREYKIIGHLFFLLIFGIQLLMGQPEAYFQHYGAEEGLPQHTITDILQDEKGFMWFSTWDGLSKFDGYTFITYRLPGGKGPTSRSSRIDRLYEDNNNNIWALSYDDKVYRFEVRHGVFRSVSEMIELEGIAFSASRIVKTNNGRVWILSDDDGCVSVADSLLELTFYHTDRGNLPGNKVYTVWDDDDDNTWILTDKGVAFYSHHKSHEKLPNNRPFYSVIQCNNEVWLGSDQGTIWRYNPKRDDFRELYTEMQGDVIAIKEISSEKIAIISNLEEFVIYNTFDESQEVYNTAFLSKMPSNRIVSCYVDRWRNLWFETEQLGVARFNPYTHHYVHFTPFIESAETSVFPPNFFIFEDNADRLWIHPRGGGFSLYDREEDRLIPFYNEPFSPQWQFSNMMHSAYSDRQGNLWMCTRSHGLEKVIFSDDAQFRSILLNDNVHSTISNDVRPIFQDSSGVTWVGTKDGKIYLYDSEMRQSGYLNSSGGTGTGMPLKGIAYCITEDTAGNIWIGTKGEGVYKLTRKKDENRFDLLHLKHDPDNLHSLSNNNVYTIYEDERGNIWIGTFGGGINLLPHGGDGSDILHHRNGLASYPFHLGDQVRIIKSDRHGNICVGTTLGLIVFRVDLQALSELEFKVYTHNNEDVGSIGANDVMDICTTLAGEIFIGTFGGGVSRIKQTDKEGFPLSFETYGSAHGLPSNIILSLLEDDRGNIWVGSEGGLSKFNHEEQTFENFSEIKRLMKRHNFSENARCRLNDGRMLFGYSHGMIIFDPDNVRNNTFKPYLALVQFRLFNRPFGVSSDGPLREEINSADAIQLKHNQNFIGIEFAALDYVDPGNILYAYKLDGFDKEWVYSGNQRVANYTNLSKGKYLFRVKSTNSDGVWADNERLLFIEVLPPYWATGWAYLVYFLITVLLLFFIYRILYAFYKMRQKISLEKQESEIKTRFFTNISHEIRTPLTMIVSPIENLLQSKATPDTVRGQLEMVSKNTNRLLNMVNQILDFQKMSQAPLRVRKVPLGPFVENLYMGYRKNAELKKIDYRFENKAGTRMLWADTEALEKIVLNLLSNAFKYTPVGGAIFVEVFNEQDCIGLRVKDNGVGISKEKQARLFRRFESFNEDKSKPSTGIGLSIVKEMADKHRAQITVESEEQKGTSFTVFFKRGTTHFGTDVVFDESTGMEQEPRPEITDWHESDVVDLPEEVGGRPTVLVVEDDEDLRLFIRSILQDEYDVYEASDGKEGFEKALELIPDFIVSDIMMPEVDGIELLENVRSNIKTSHILFLLLTAKTTLESKLDGFEHGADEYISKPFSVSFFKARVKSLLRRRKELQKYYRERSFSAADGCVAIGVDSTASLRSEKDLAFIQRVNSFIERHLGSDDFVIEDLAMEAGMSRSVFFKKVKGLTGLAPVEYVRDILMQHAARQLLNGDFTVKEVAYMVGMSDAKYFTKCFKKKYGMTPSEYKKSIVNK